MFFRLLSGVVMTVAILFSGCAPEADDTPPVTSHSYRGHERDADINCFVRAYPDAAGSRLDDCVLCHAEGEVTDGRGRVRAVSACDFCHHLHAADKSFYASLNPFGEAFAGNGRNEEAFRKIEGTDSDGDHHTNLDEIRAGFFPGRESSNPDQPAAPIVKLTFSELRSLPSHQQFMLLNSHRQRCDSYVTYRGVTISDLLKSQGIDLAGIEGITVFAPDGFAKTYSREQVIGKYPAGEFHSGLDDAGLGEGEGIVVYPARIPFDELENGQAIPGEPQLLLAFERDSGPMSVSSMTLNEGKIRGEGPFRIVRPQTVPSRPDRGSRYPRGDEYDCDESLDHNAGDSVRGVTVIRIDPMPEGLEEFDARNASWRFLERKMLVIYGHGIR